MRKQERIMLPASRNNSNLRQRIWAMMVSPWTNLTRQLPVGTTPRPVFFPRIINVRAFPNPNFVANPMATPPPQDVGVGLMNVIDMTTPGSLLPGDFELWVLTMMDSSYYNLLERAKRYAYYYDVPMDNILFMEIIPADFNFAPQL